MSEGFGIHELVLYSSSNPLQIQIILGSAFMKYFARSYHKIMGFLFFSHFACQICNSINKIIIFI